VLDLGCGTGTVALSILRVFPNAHLTCLYLAENMIAMARADVVLASSDFLQNIYMDQWLAFMSRSVSEAEIEAKWIPKYYAEDHPAN
jgi:trans-aconitate methyltransferase